MRKMQTCQKSSLELSRNITLSFSYFLGGAHGAWAPMGAPIIAIIPNILINLREFVWETSVILAQARDERGPETVNRGGGVARNSRRSNGTLADILCGTPSAAAVWCVFSQKGHSGCSPVRSEKPGPPFGNLSGPIFPKKKGGGAWAPMGAPHNSHNLINILITILIMS